MIKLLTENEYAKSSVYNVNQYVSIDDNCSIHDWGKYITDAINKSNNCLSMIKFLTDSTRIIQTIDGDGLAITSIIRERD